MTLVRLSQLRVYIILYECIMKFDWKLHTSCDRLYGWFFAESAQKYMC